MKLLSLLISAQAALSCVITTRDVDTESPLALSLEMTGNTKIKAKLTNSGDKALKLFNTGTILDTKPVEKVQVLAGDRVVPFEGIYLRVLQTDLGDDVFTTVGAKETIDIDIDLAELYNLRAGGEYTIQAQGALPYAELGSNELNGAAIAYSSNAVTTTVDGAEAAGVKLVSELFRERLQSRSELTKVATDCQGNKDTSTRAALVGCAKLAAAASQEALTGSVEKFREYFKANDTATRKQVSDRLAKVAAECESSSTDLARLSCVDGMQSCSSRVLAYTQPATGYMVNCNLYFTALGGMPKQCHGQDQATTTLHEMTHVRAVYAPNTVDNAYGYAASSKLTSRQALLNANTFELYTVDIALSCPVPKA